MGIPAWHVTLCLCMAREFHTSQSSYTLLKWPLGREGQEEKFRPEPYSSVSTTWLYGKAIGSLQDRSPRPCQASHKLCAIVCPHGLSFPI